MTAPASPLPRIVRLAEVDSTQEIAFALAREGAADGTVVLTDFQRTGRGRRGRPWVAPPGMSLLASIIVRPRLEPVGWPLYSFVAALAVADMLDEVGVAGATVAWPNDVLVRGRKISGILLEARSDAGVLVPGIGVNLRQRTFPESLRVPATSVALETGTEIDRDRALDVLLETFACWRGRLEDEGFSPVRARWVDRSATLGTRVRIDTVEGVAVDLADNGALAVLDDAGRRHEIVAGDVVPADSVRMPAHEEG